MLQHLYGITATHGNRQTVICSRQALEISITALLQDTYPAHNVWEHEVSGMSPALKGLIFLLRNTPHMYETNRE